MDTRFWGPSGWRLLHIVSFVAPSLPQKSLQIFFKNLPYVLPCKFCRASLTDYYAADPIPANPKEMASWLYRIHNRVNAKLRDQKLLEAQNPPWEEIEKRYKDWIEAPCTQRRMVGWDFLFSVAFTTPCAQVATSPMPDAPPKESIKTPELRNRWGVISDKERLPYIQEWWKVLPDVLPFERWRSLWRKVVLKGPDVFKGRKTVTAWLYKAEKAMCAALREDAPHDSFNGLCSELSTFSSGCGRNKSKRMKTCRAIKSYARKSLKTRRVKKYKAVGGFL